MTLYLIDANVLIDAHDNYYPFDRIPHFWQWLLGLGLADVVKIPSEIYEEVAPNRGSMPQWLRERHVRDALVLPEAANMGLVQHVLDVGYGTDLSEDEIERIGQDPFLIAAARAGNNRAVVTNEGSKPTAKRGKTKIPDACMRVGVQSMHAFEFYRKLAFSIPF
jgi:hypothetical protein